MVQQTCSIPLHELQQIEFIIRQDNQRFLDIKTLGTVPYGEHKLPIYALSLGNPNAGIPSISYIGGIHGLERIGTKVVLTFLETLLNRLRWDVTFEEVLNKVRINFLPLMNPVGMINHTRSNGAGIDLMRNAPIDCQEKTIWLASGHRLSKHIPWFRGHAEEPMQQEAQMLCDFVETSVFPSPFNLVLDCHSGFGFHNQIWFPYAKSRLEPIKHIGEIYYLRHLFFQTYPHQNYKFEPQSQNYLTHGDLWDFLYLRALERNNSIFLPLTLEMGSWRWVRKNPLQIFKSLGLYHPIKPHRISRVLRGHLILMDFLLRATLSYEKWLDFSHTETMAHEAKTLWYDHF